jgi:hypothetical protein
MGLAARVRFAVETRLVPPSHSVKTSLGSTQSPVHWASGAISPERKDCRLFLFGADIKNSEAISAVLHVLSTRITAYLPTYLPACLPAYLPIYPPTFPPTYLPTYDPPSHSPTYLSIYPPTHLPIHPLAYPPTHLCVLIHPPTHTHTPIPSHLRTTHLYLTTGLVWSEELGKLKLFHLIRCRTHGLPA